MTSVQTIRAPIIGILIIESAALFARAFLEMELQAGGLGKTFSADLSYLVVPPIIGILLFPILRIHKTFLWGQFRREHLTLKLVLSAIGIGLSLRIAWWCQLLFRISTGITSNTDEAIAMNPVFAFGCPPPTAILLGIFVMAVLVPIVEEVINRGLIQSTLASRGKTFAILISAVFFAAYHSPSGYYIAFFLGLVLGVQFWNSGTLWFSLITHSTYNGLVQLDWRCITGKWNPIAAELPLTSIVVVSAAGFILCLTAVAFLIRKNTVEAQ
jgi:membrane protease YdiL (CAAX protease family)